MLSTTAANATASVGLTLTDSLSRKPRGTSWAESMTDSQTEDTYGHWLLDDAVVLYRLGRKHSAILLLLCAVDALAREADPSNRNNADRFESYLRTQMRRPGRAQIHSIEVARLKRSFSFEYIIYKFLRCPLVHEGARLEAGDQAEFIVCLDWDTIPHGLKLEPDQNRILLGGELVLDVLADAVQHGIGVPAGSAQQAHRADAVS